MSVTLSSAQRNQFIKLVARLVTTGVSVSVTLSPEEGIIVYKPNSEGGVNMIAIDEDGDCMVSVATKSLQDGYREFYSELTDSIFNIFCYHSTTS